MDLGLSKKRVLISGGTSGIGLATAKAFLQEEADVVIMGRNEARGQSALQKLSDSLDLDRRLDFISCDIRLREDCRRALDAACARLGGLDILINSAGIYQEGAFSEVSGKDIENIMATNVMGTMWLTQASIPALIDGGGNIINLASDAGLHGNYFAAAYCATKGAIVLFTRALALELASRKVRVNAVAPGDILTEMTEEQLHASSLSREEALHEMESIYPLGRIGTPEEVAGLILFLASERACFITGSVYSMDGGLMA